jgi:hypothetical protein
MRDTIDMARESHLDVYGLGKDHAKFVDTLKAFEALVRADERNSWPAEMEAMERQVNILTDALAQSRKPLTVGEIAELADRHLDVGDGSYATHYVFGETEFARAIEAAHGIKENT